MIIFRKIIFLISIGYLFLSCHPKKQTNNETKIAYTPNEYVGEAACIQCHQTAYTTWKGSHHDWAMKLTSNTTVLGDFNNVSFSSDGENYLFYKMDSAYYVKTGEVGSEVDHEIAYTFGVTPLQQYLIKFPDGKYQTLRATWDTEKELWFNQYEGQSVPHNDWLHWTEGGQRWNTMCAECHSTNLKKNYNLAKDVFTTSYDNITVSCEACHGPAGAHMNWASLDSPKGKPQIKSVGYDQVSQLNQCAGCHARRVKLTEVMKPNISFDDQFMLQTINSEYYHADGQIKEEDYVLGSFVQSKMFAQGVKCSDCHNAHSMKLKQEGNALCMQCHTPDYNTEAHHFHKGENESTQCVSCHMTGAVFMGNDFRRDHSFRIPRPDQSSQFDTPNACTGCHQEKTDTWAADWIVKWYGTERADHFSDYLLEASRPPYDNATRKEVLQFINNLNFPAIARATALEYYPLRGDQDDFEMLIEALQDSSALVRYNALSKFQMYPIDQKLSFALEHMYDSTRLVRIGAAQLITEMDLSQLEPKQRGQAQMVRNEHLEMLRANADFPLGRLQLGDYYFKQRKTQRAIKEYEMAVTMDSLLTPVYSNLATAYSIIGKNDKALQTLNQLISLEPEFARAYYLRGLLYYEVGNQRNAILDLEKSIYFDPLNFRAHYNLANLHLLAKEFSKAELVMLAGLELQPESNEGLHLLKLIKSGK
jgi:predicted CXXCH cytochrome family protein